jgi:hypothetical protein
MPLEFGNNTDVTISGKLETLGFEDIKFTTSNVNNVLGRINGNVDENGGELQFYTNSTDNSLVERLRLNNAGAIGIAGDNYGTNGQVLTSNGPNAPVSWENGGTTYTAGTGVSISQSNVISIGQEVGTNANPTFANLNVSGILSPEFVDRVNISGSDGILNFVAGKISANSESDLMFHTRTVNDLIERLRLNNAGAIGIAGDNYGTNGQVLTSNGPNAPVSWENGGTTYTAGTGVSISQSNVISIGQEVGTNANPTFANLNVSGILSPEFVDRVNISGSDGILNFVAGKISANSESDLMFHTRTVNDLIERLRLNNAGAIGIAGDNYGTNGQVLTSNGPNAPVSWENGATAYTAGVGLSLDGTEFTNTAPDQTVVLNSGDGISITGTYPTFTISSDAGGGGSGAYLEEATIQTLTCNTIMGNSDGGLPPEWNAPPDRLRVDIPNMPAHLDFYQNQETVVVGVREIASTQRQYLTLQCQGAPHNTNFCSIDLFSNIDGGGTYARLTASSQPGIISPLVTAAGNYSDDRMKFNETSLTQETAINLIQQLIIKDYMKTNIMMRPDQEQIFQNGGDGFAEYKTQVDNPTNPNSFYEPFREVGVIAQQVPQDLRFMVSEGDEEKNYLVKYNNLISLNTCVIQNLLERVAALEARIN